MGWATNGSFALVAAQRLVAIVMGIGLVSGGVVHRSQSAFTDVTENTGNRVGAATIRLTDNDNGTALFDVLSLSAGSRQERCIEVTYDGDLDASGPIRLSGAYADGPDANTSAESQLAPYLDMQVSVGTAGSSCTTFTPAGAPVYSGTMSGFTAAHSGWADGLATGWTPAGGSAQTRAFTISVELADDDASQGKTVEPLFTWQVRA